MKYPDALTLISNEVKINGIDAGLNKVEEMKNEYLKSKNFSPYKSCDGRWRGYVYFETDGKKKRKAITSMDLLELEKKAIMFYKEKDPYLDSKPMTLKRLFPLFVEARKEEGVSDSTIVHDHYDWKRYLEYEDFVNRPLKDIEYPEFVSWFKKKLIAGLQDKKNGGMIPFTSKQAKNMRSLLTTLFQYAVDCGYIKENYSVKMGKFFYQKFCKDVYKRDSEQVYQDDEPTKIMNLAFQRFNETKNFAYLAVILNFLLDLRVGELVVLKYSDMEDVKGQIHIQRQELPVRVYNESKGRTERCGFKEVEHTKTWQDRFINLSDAAINVIGIIKKEQESLGIKSEYLFINKNGDRMHENSVNGVLRLVLNPGIGTSQKSCHNIRKTVTSELRDALGVSIAARVAGHKNESTTDQHYSFSTTSNEFLQSEYTSVIDKKVPSFLKFKIC